MNQRTVAFLVTALAVLAVLAIAIFALACEVPSGVADALGLQQELPTAPAEIRIFLAGNCQAPERGNRIECFDDSTSEPARQLVAITFTLIDSQGITRATERIDPRLVQQREISFRNLAGDTYEVHHVVVASNGAEAKVIYSGLEVWP